jgi:hypothetical protein
LVSKVTDCDAGFASEAQVYKLTSADFVSKVSTSEAKLASEVHATFKETPSAINKDSKDSTKMVWKPKEVKIEAAPLPTINTNPSATINLTEFDLITIVDETLHVQPKTSEA